MTADPTANVLQELTSFRDPKVLSMFEIYEDRGWIRNLFTTNERWIEVQWLDDDHIRLNLVSRQPSSAMPADWASAGPSQWIVSAKDSRSLADWINREWLHVRSSERMKLRMWND